jgi:hypothetical protein
VTLLYLILLAISNFFGGNMLPTYSGCISALKMEAEVFSETTVTT